MIPKDFSDKIEPPLSSEIDLLKVRVRFLLLLCVVAEEHYLLVVFPFRPSVGTGRRRGRGRGGGREERGGVLLLCFSNGRPFL